MEKIYNALQKKEKKQIRTLMELISNENNCAELTYSTQNGDSWSIEIPNNSSKHERINLYDYLEDVMAFLILCGGSAIYRRKNKNSKDEVYGFAFVDRKIYSLTPENLKKCFNTCSCCGEVTECDDDPEIYLEMAI